MSVTVSFDGELGSIVDRIARGVSDEAPRALLLAAEHAAGEVRRTAQALNSSGSARGGLARSFKASFNSVQGDTLSAGAYSDLPYADIQNRGGRIKAKKRKLAVPVKGVARAGKWPRDYPKGFLFRVGNLLVHKTENTKAGKYRKGTLFGLKIYFVLRSSVKIEPTGYIDFASESAEPKIVEIMGDLAQRAIEGA